MTDAQPFSSDRYDWPGRRFEQLRPDDAADAADFLCAMDPWKTLAVRPDTMHSYLLKKDPALRKFSVFADEKIAGVIAVRYPWLRGPYLELLAVRPEFQGRGIGHRLITWMIGESSPTCSNIWVMVSGFNAPARDFYSREGFVETAVMPDFIRKGLVEILMRKILAKDHG